MTNKQSWGDKLSEIIDDVCGYEYLDSREKKIIIDYVTSVLTSKSEQMEREKRTIPGRVCINAESHLFGKCFQCEESKGFNAGISACIEILKK